MLEWIGIIAFAVSLGIISFQRESIRQSKEDIEGWRDAYDTLSKRSIEVAKERIRDNEEWRAEVDGLLAKNDELALRLKSLQAEEESKNEALRKILFTAETAIQ